MNIFDYLKDNPDGIEIIIRKARPDAPKPGGTTPTGDPTPPDAQATGLLREGFLVLDAAGAPVVGRLDAPGQAFGYFSTLPGMPRWGFSQRWQGFVRAPVTGNIRLSATMKSGGWLKWGSEVLFEQDREGDPGNHVQWQAAATVAVKAGEWYYLEVVHNVQDGAGEQVCRVQWSLADAAEPVDIPITACRPPADWKTRLKDYTPPPDPDELPDPNWSTYRSPEFAPGFRFFPESYAWYQRVDAAPLDPNSDRIIAGLNKAILHPEFGPTAGFPINVLTNADLLSLIAFDTREESDNVHYRVPVLPVLEPADDRHYIGYYPEGATVYEVYQLRKAAGKWFGVSGVAWDINSIPSRPAGWTSADASGGPMVCGLIRPEEVFRDKAINHAVRVTASTSRICPDYVYPANHLVHDSGPMDGSGVRMGCRFRVKASVDISGLPEPCRVIAQAMKDYGLIVTDGTTSNQMFFSGCPDSRWDNNVLGTLRQLTSDDLEVVKT